jgi:hypothetical protein
LIYAKPVFPKQPNIGTVFLPTVLFQAPAPSSILEVEVSEDGEDDENGGDNGEMSESVEKSWDGLLIDDEDEDSKLLGMDTDIDSD